MPSTDDETRASAPRKTSHPGRRKRMRARRLRIASLHRETVAGGAEHPIYRPALAMTRLSKSLVVSESIVHQKQQRVQRLACAQRIRAQESLVAEVNTLRAGHPRPAGGRTSSSYFSAAARAMLEVF
ncbi:hypothetical protein C8R44DRAFT_990788, partial [Mycena epipterygia]